MVAGGDGAGLLTNSGRVVELVVGGKECNAESAFVDQMELPNGVVADQGFRVLPRSDAVGAVGEPEVLGQEFGETLLGMSQMDAEGTAVNSGQLC